MLVSSFLILAGGISSAIAAHTVQVNNRCGEKFTMQVPGRGIVTSNGGGAWSYDGDTNGVIASVGNNCDINGVPCTAAEFSLVSGVTSADITLIPPHAYNKSLRITLTNGQSKSCSSPDCSEAFHSDGNDGLYQIQESGNPNSGITLDFCI
ncbi:hypothetical protein PCANC_04763 [Puccinia coronata f. sp. avenae]|uniref:Uncharacterized protein n=1 Tax=Puccinia coronata f. sp. avenae TaxID=200324 RepID=A0A2N5SZR6_9BASI|nr:hypothetical protein PCANC_17395 [Puccinia coronata f. sp. avenae]PLW18722.1 hypothetical protein PCASD_15375 [Puccinia coronata f. sp. avenae]PLW49944.1 hypothetical protein PCASD_01342 [Puccinia coronata f. sp. avenae]PLW54450.1 hypothetical protein PCANC_04763 [Puccinia coronata f. sp. avenae]